MVLLVLGWPPPDSEDVKSDQSNVSAAELLRVKLSYRTRCSWHGQTQLFHIPSMKDARDHIQHGN